ncbi:MAG: hypothetical protein IBX68_03260 [Dehalococcoidia bacterium]|nr:hypothetical protein [Dehalococcoidia bacterium]
MRILGLVLSLISLFITAGGILAYFADRTGVGIAGMATGVSLLGVGVMLFLTDFLLRLMQRGARLRIDLVLWKLRFGLEGEMGKPGEENAGPRPPRETK